MKNYCTDAKLEEWKDKSLRAEKRWVEIFCHMKRNDVPFDKFACVIEFALCFPGSSALVERIFSLAKKLWTDGKSSLHIETLNAILFVKNNLDYDCIEFHKFLKTQPELLKQISSMEKYDFEVPENVQKNPGAMSIDDE